jgi:ABC-type nitrate/sulfonate/bicarbonate transport system substrate-binding protein
MRRELLLGLSLAIASAACAREDKASNQRELPKVRISAGRLMHWAPVMIARAEGFFRDEGIDVEFVPIPSAQENVVALVSGSLDILSGPTHATLFSAIQQGAKIRIVAGQGFLARNGCTYYGIVKRRDLGPDSNIRRLRASRDGLTRFVTERMLEHAGVDINKLDVNRLSDAVAISSFLSGSVDAVATGEPTLTRLKSTGSLWLTAEKVVPDFQWGTIVFGERLLYKDRDTGARFLRAVDRGVAQYMQGKTERNVAIIAKETGESPDLIRSACWISYQPDLRVNWQSLEEFQTWAKKQGLIKNILSRDQAMETTFHSKIFRTTESKQ